MFLYHVKLVFNDGMFMDTVWTILDICMNKYYNKTAQRWNNMQDCCSKNVNQK